MPKPTFLAAAAALALAVALPATASAKSDGSTPAKADVVTAVTTIPATTYDAVGAGPAFDKDFVLKPLKGAAAPAGKVDVLSFNFAWCPHCAANSWPLAAALSRFGTLSGLRQIDTGTYFAKVVKAKPGFSHTKGLSFSKATLDSPYLTFSPVVAYNLKGKLIQRPTKDQLKRLQSVEKQLGAPTVVIGSGYGAVGATFGPDVLTGKSASTIAGGLADPTNPLTQKILGEANLLTAAICTQTAQQPAAVCASAGVTAAAARLV
ncbi:MAG: DUF929 family protein [Solirubrobacteraceae bacterium]|nr:DUF929 family protein [Patulibacter sp.]